jgi:hypothetical protein
VSSTGAVVPSGERPSPAVARSTRRQKAQTSPEVGEPQRMHGAIAVSSAVSRSVAAVRNSSCARRRKLK